MDRETLDFYEGQAATYADYMAAGKRVPWLDRFMALLPAGAAVLDLGCGSAWAAARMREAGFEVSAMDASPALAAEARARYGIEVRVAPFSALDAEGAYDAVWASFSLLHDSRAAMPGNLARIRRALRPGGLLYLGLKEGEGAHRDRLGRLYTYFGADELARLLGEAGFTEIERAGETGESYDGSPTRFIQVLARRDG